MRTVTASEANQHFSRLLGEAERGEEILITRRGKPAVRLVRAVVDDERERRIRAADEAMKVYRSRPNIIAHGWTRDSLYDDALGL